MQEKIVILKPEKVQEKKRKILNEGAKNFHVLADFDRTLTNAFVEGKKIPSIISVLRDGNYLSLEYTKKARELFEKYHPIETDLNLSDEEKKVAMREWWETHFDLLINSGLNKNDLERIVKEGAIVLRKGVLEFFNLLNEKRIPLVILSSSGIGDVISIYLRNQRKMYDNIYVVSNFYEWDEKGNAVCVKKPIIHAMNKDEVIFKELPFYNDISNRKNVLLLGDSLGDLKMIKGVDYNNLISVGFLNEKIKENLDLYKKFFDVVISGDGSFEWANNFIKGF